MRSELFADQFKENQTTEKFVLQSKKMLRATLDGRSTVIASAGSMVAYQGNISFGYKGSGSVKNFIKKAVSGENARLMTVSGQGDVFFAKEAREIFTVFMEGNDALSVSSHSLLAFDDTLAYDIKMMRSVAGAMGGGLFNVQVSGHGYLALVSDGQPLVLDCSQQPTFVDPDAIICWSANLTPTMKNDTNLGSFIGRGSGESVQIGFHGPGFVVLQPSEGPKGELQSSGSSGPSLSFG